MTVDIIKKLNEKIDPSFVKKRKGGAGKELAYIEGWNAENNANQIFNFKWHKQTAEPKLLFDRIYKNSKEKEMFEVAYSCVVEVKVLINNEWIIRTGVGFGNGQASPNQPSQAYELALKEAETDATKRALKSLGSQFGIDLYDKNYDIKADYMDDWLSNKDVITFNNNLKKTKTEEEIRTLISTYTGAYKDNCIKIATKHKKALQNENN